MNNIQIFSSLEFGAIRTVVIDGEPWFVGKDITEALGYGDGNKKSKALTNAISDHVDEDDKKLIPYKFFKGCQNGDLKDISHYGATIINESGMYSLIFGSKLESAKKFKHWVTSEVLPSIRKTGTYGQPKSPIELLELEFKAIKEIDNKVEAVNKDLQDFKMDMPILGIEIDRITEAVHRRGVEALGGKKSNAYRDRSLHGKVFSDIYRELKRQFSVTSYKAIKRNQCNLAVSLIDEYELPFMLAEQIKDCNAQMNMDMA